MFKKFIILAWVCLLAYCQLAAAAPAASVSATPSNPSAPATVTLSIAVTTDADPITVTQVEYFTGATSLGVALQAPFDLTLDNLAAGTYRITAKVTTTDASYPLLQSPQFALTVGAGPGAAGVYFIHTDQLNTPRAISNAGGAMVWQWDSDPFGKDAADEQPGGQPAFGHTQRFPGQQFDRESNLHYNYFRDYDPQLGRYVESDPIGLRGGINTFAYVNGNPLSLIDRLGLAGIGPDGTCTGPDCVNPPYDASKDGPVPSPQPGKDMKPQKAASDAGRYDFCPKADNGWGKKWSNKWCKGCVDWACNAGGGGTRAWCCEADRKKCIATAYEDEEQVAACNATYATCNFKGGK